jgi:hypothetical protein
MANTLEMVPLRSKFPNTGHITVRHVQPVINPVAPLDLIVEDLQDILDSIDSIDSLESSTTPQVAGATPGVGETMARKGGQAQ